MDESTTGISFRRPTKKAFFLRTYCEKQYKACEIYNMLMDKYTDD